ncbi:D-hexose-6-phosphate mutarotase [Undibacterium fentianense]|uniref:Putative glucose-6-phosphate 1-epimerase n=1 Tax=Undibacterium fentianense TaxID=2828728 RepID=A0A941E3A8_9BURK|nr:D-hexose-6-phosphate mutarotase [Undibacterium fentianense]MBR7800706.1 D-hexose-6-phosphate mutarotase [Undibacterium fentianense]
MNKVLLESRDGARAEITQHGAHLCSWIPSGGVEQLFLSDASEFREGAAIRGGVPIVFPQFSNLGPLPKHGFARTAYWQLVRAEQLSEGAAQAIFTLQDDVSSRSIWPHAFRAEFTITVEKDSLQMDFSVSNLGEMELHFQAALHTYFRIGALEDTRIAGLGGLHYHDTVTDDRNRYQEEAILEFQGETDRIYADISSDLKILQPHQTVIVRQTGFEDAVVWNPGARKGAELKDLETDGYRYMVCVEAAQILKPIHLAPGQSWVGSQCLTVVPTLG